MTLIVIACEMGAVWSELRGIRQEQVKNAVYSMRPNMVQQLQASPDGKLRLRQLSSQSSVVGGTGDVLSVKIEGTLLDPIYIQAGRPVPVLVGR